MQHMNNDMDELFRKAAEEYPLDTRNADWNKIAGRLGDVTTPTVPEKRSYRRFGWLLLLVPLAFVVMQYGSKILPGSVDRIAAEPNSSEPNSSEANSSEANQSATKPFEASQSATKPFEANQSATRAVGTNQSATKPLEANQSETNPTGTNALASNASKTNASVTNAPVTYAPVTKGLKKLITPAGNKLPAESGISAPQDIPSGNSDDLKERVKTPGPDQLHGDNTPLNAPPEGYTRAGRKEGTGKGQTGIATIGDQSPDQRLTGAGSSSNTEMIGYELSAYNKSLPLSREQADIAAVRIPPMTKVVAGPMRKQGNISTNGFYIGAVIGLDVSAVKLQKFSGVGFHYGGTMGYQFARRFSVEAGLYAAKKYYYTKGEYFDKGKMVVNPSSTILSVDGACLMFEIPVSIKYDFHNTYKSNFFVTGGFSSYIMKEENYAMLYRYNSSGTTAVHDYTYKNSSRNFFAELRLTAGYAFKLPKAFSLRLEPYVNIPVNGVGYGKLNLMSAGVNAGIFKRIF